MTTKSKKTEAEAEAEAEAAPGNATVEISGVHVPIVDPSHIPAVSADVITEIRDYSGIMALGFATFRKDGTAPIEAVVCARLRMSMKGALILRDILDAYLKGCGYVQQDAAPQVETREAGTTH